MPLSELCRCPACLPSIPPDPATGTPAEHAAHRDHLRKLGAIGALPDPAFHPYPQQPPAHGAAAGLASPAPTW